MPNLQNAPIALIVYVVGLILTVIYNVFNGRRGYHKPQMDTNRNVWSGVLYLRGLLLYPSIAFLTYWAIGRSGILFGLLFGIGALIFKSMVNRTSWAMF
jgi:hypothetical protein